MKSVVSSLISWSQRDERRGERKTYNGKKKWERTLRKERGEDHTVVNCVSEQQGFSRMLKG